MPTGPRFARVSYTLFTVAVLAALIKLGAVSGANPFVLRMVPATSVAKAVEVVREETGGRQLDLPDPERYTLGGPLSPSLAGSMKKKEEEKHDAPVFFRPSKEARDRGNEPVCGNLDDFPKSSRAIFPLEKSYFDSYEDTWGAARPQGGHEGTDLMSPIGTPEFAITDGTIVPVSGANKNGWNTLGGYTVMLEAAYDVGPIRKGDLFYYAHLDEKSALPIGTKVRAGQQVGVAGDTGEGREVTRGKFPSHLHLGWYDTGSAGERTNLESGAMNPYPLLMWLEENGGTVAGGTDASYCEAPQEPESSTDGDPASGSPGTRPDLDTGSAEDARPSPVVEESRHDHPPARQNKPNSKKNTDKVGEQLDTPGKDPSKHSDKPEKKEQEGHDETPTPNDSARSEEQPSHPPTDDPSSPEIQENNRSSASGPRLHSGWASRSSLVSILAESTEEENRNEDSEKLEGKQKKPTKVPEDKRPKASEPDRSRPAESPRDGTEPPAPEPANPDQPPASCDPERKSDKEPGVYITRTQERSEAQHPIERDEWLALIRDDPEMQVCRTAVDRLPRNDEEVLALWTGHPSRDEVWFELRDGKISVKNPDEPTIEKMRVIAEALEARVQGDGRREY